MPVTFHCFTNSIYISIIFHPPFHHCSIYQAMKLTFAACATPAASAAASSPTRKRPRPSDATDDDDMLATILASFPGLRAVVTHAWLEALVKRMLAVQGAGAAQQRGGGGKGKCGKGKAKAGAAAGAGLGVVELPALAE